MTEQTSSPNSTEESQKLVWGLVDDWHALFQGLRSLMRFCTLTHDNTENPNYPHPVADFFERIFGNLEQHWDEDGNVSNTAFTVLSLVYLLYLLLVLAKKAHNSIKKGETDLHLPQRIKYALFEATIWGCYNLASSILSIFKKIDPELLGAATFGVFSVLILADSWNAMREQVAYIKSYDEKLQILRKETATEQRTQFDIDREVSELKTQKLIAQSKWICALGFGVFAAVGASCMAISSGLTYGKVVLEAVEHLGFAGAWFLSGAALLYAVFRLVGELVSYGMESAKVSQAIVQINAALITPGANLPLLLTQKNQLLHRQRELRYEVTKSIIYYSCLILLMGISLFAGPVAGLIAFATFFILCLLSKHFIEPQIRKHFIDVKVNTVSAAPTDIAKSAKASETKRTIEAQKTADPIYPHSTGIPKRNVPQATQTRAAKYAEKTRKISQHAQFQLINFLWQVMGTTQPTQPYPAGPPPAPGLRETIHSGMVVR